ncbi:MAG: large conductance mechanosensitive channel protein MscL [Actinomycetia bacterium]|nr:large conductance mechanosensitive channel protein MscL [Actinomycetes bacterium]
MKGFKEFIMRGNVIDLAVAFVIGVAVAALIGSIVDWIITPLIAAIFGEPDLSSVATFTINGAVFSIGAVLTALINFLAIAAAVYFLVVLPMNKLRERSAKPEEPAGPTDVDLLTEIRDALVARKDTLGS